MHSSLFFFFLVIFLTYSQHFNVTSADDYDYLHYTCSSTGKDAKNDAYQSNLAKLFAALSTDVVVASGGFAKNVTDLPYRIYGLALCRGDVNSAVCGDCVNRSVAEIQTMCANSQQATIWYDFCYLHYSNNDFFSSTDNSEQFVMWNSDNVTTSAERFSGWSATNAVAESYLTAMMEALLSGVAYRAAYDSYKMFAVGDTNVTASGPMIYSMSQCTPDMANDTCHSCLDGLIGDLIANFEGREGGRILGVRCSVRYEVYDFFTENQGLLPINSISGPVQPSVPEAEDGNGVAVTPSGAPQSHNSSTPAPAPSLVSTRTSKASTFFSGATKKVFIIIINVIAAVVLLGCIVGFYWLKKSRYAGMDISPKNSLGSSDEIPSIWARDRSSDFTFFDFDQIVRATENFSLGRKLGQGGFGTVYKGVLEDGLEVAVKRLSAQSLQGIVEFKNEIQLIAKLQHTNLVRLVGWCNHDEEKLLVYECMPNKSLDTFIFDKRRGALLNWEKRYQIIEGIAQGLLYLHKHSRLRIVHRDLKASNILLDSEMVPKISDFGLARIFDPKELQTSTNRVVGTYGYMAPEYASEGLFSVKSDVYSFGVLLLEIISGKRNMGFRQYGEFLNLIGYAWDRWREGQISELISPCLSEASIKQIERCIHVALLCVQENPIDRPIISDVITFLSTENIILPEPKQPAYFNIRITENVFESSYFYGSSRSINYITMSAPEGR